MYDGPIALMLKNKYNITRLKTKNTLLYIATSQTKYTKK